jgi:hypothetical protein
MIQFIISFILSMVGIVLLMWIPTWIYLFFKEFTRVILYRMGFRVFTKKEMIDRGYIKQVKNGVVEAEVVNLTEKEKHDTIVVEEDAFETLFRNLDESLEECREKQLAFETAMKNKKNRRR